MTEAVREEQEAILKYLAPHVEECLYLYMDIYWYGIGSDKISVWYEKNGNSYALIVMKYFDCFQIYSENNVFNVNAFSDLVKEQHIDRIFARRPTIEYLEQYLKEDYFTEFGKIIEIKKHRNFSKFYDMISEATVDDVPEIADLLLTDEENALSYEKTELEESLKDLIRTGMGRLFIIRQDGEIVAHVAISAETDLFMIGSYTMVHKDYRNTMYGMVMDSYLNNIIRGEKRLFGFVLDARRIAMFKALGNDVAAEYGKLIRKK